MSGQKVPTICHCSKAFKIIHFFQRLKYVDQTSLKHRCSWYLLTYYQKQMYYLVWSQKTVYIIFVCFWQNIHLPQKWWNEENDYMAPKLHVGINYLRYKWWTVSQLFQGLQPTATLWPIIWLSMLSYESKTCTLWYKVWTYKYFSEIKYVTHGKKVQQTKHTLTNNMLQLLCNELMFKLGIEGIICESSSKLAQL